jgi:predicted dienelactone hydrolase
VSRSVGMTGLRIGISVQRSGLKRFISALLLISVAMRSPQVAEAGSDPGVRLVSDITIPDDNTGDVPISVDLYVPDEHSTIASAGGSRGLPCVILAPGAAGPKELFSGAGTGLARAGFAVVVISQLRNASESFELVRADAI